MTTLEDIPFIEHCLGYPFKDGSHLTSALTPVSDEGTEDGNQSLGNGSLAKMGMIIVQLVLAFIGYKDEAGAEGAPKREEFGGLDHCNKCAEQTKLLIWLKRQNSGPRCSELLWRAVNAILAAVFLDSKDFNQVVRGMIALGLFAHDEYGVRPRLLSTGKVVDASSVRHIIVPKMIQPRSVDLVQHSMVYDPEHTRSPATDLLDTYANQPLWAQMVNEIGEDHLESGDLGSPLLHSSFPEFVTGGIEQGASEFRESSVSQASDEVPRIDSDSQVSSEQSTPVAPRPRARRRLARERSRTPDSATTLATYLAEEKLRCDTHACLPPTETFFTNHTRRSLERVGAQHADALKILSVTLSSGDVVANLVNAVSSYWQDRLLGFQLTPQSSVVVLFEQIESLNCSIALSIILRRYYILYLYRACVPANSRANQSFIIMETPGGTASRSPGNPENRAKADITNFMMAQIYPHPTPDKGERDRRRKKTTELHRLGWRYARLAEIFGDGILALIPHDSDSTKPKMGTSDHTIYTLREGAFSTWVGILDEADGESLRAFGAAALQLIEPVLSGVLLDADRRQVDDLRLRNIRQYPKGSPELLDALR